LKPMVPRSPQLERKRQQKIPKKGRKRKNFI